MTAAMAAHADLWRGLDRATFETTRMPELVERIASAIAGLDDRLGLEVSETDDGHEAIVTAHGDPEAFETVDEIVASAPEVPGWTFVALHPPRGFDFEVSAGGKRFEASRLTFEPLPAADGSLRVRLHVPDPSAPEWDELAALVIETGIGERLAARIDGIEVGERPESSENVFALEMLGAYVGRHAPA
jgi:hypothetical protein